MTQDCAARAQQGRGWRGGLPRGSQVVAIETHHRLRRHASQVLYVPTVRAPVDHAAAACRQLTARYPSLRGVLSRARSESLRVARELSARRYMIWLTWFQAARADNIASLTGATFALTKVIDERAAGLEEVVVREERRRPGFLSRLRRKMAPLALTAGMFLSGVGFSSPAAAQSADAQTFDGHVSGVAAVQGYEGADWHTDVALFNAGDTTATVRIVYAPKGATPDPDSFVPVTVDPDQTVFLADVVATTFATQGSGALSYTVLDAAPEDIVVTANTYNKVSSTERFGQFVPGEPWSAAASATVPVLVPTAVDYTDYRTNLDIQLGPATTTYRVVVRNKSGNELFNQEFTAPAGSWVQHTKFVQSWASGQLPGVYALVIGEDGPVSAAADLINNATGDSSHVIGRTISGTEEYVWLTGAARVKGANNADWRSNLEIVNPHSSQQAMSISYLPRGQENPMGSFMIQPYSLLALQAHTFPDVVGDYLAQPDGSVGTIWVSTMPETVPFSFLQTFNYAGTDDQGRAVTYGQNVPAVNWDAGAAGDLEAVVAGVVDDDQSRANLLVQNTRYDTVNNVFLPSDVAITLLKEDGSIAAQHQVTLRPGEYAQFDKFPEQWVGADYRGTVITRTTPLGQHERGGVNVAVTVVNGNSVPGTNDAALIPHQLVNSPNQAPVFDNNDVFCDGIDDGLVDVNPQDGVIDRGILAYISDNYSGCIVASDPNGDHLNYTWTDIDRGGVPAGFTWTGNEWQWDMSNPSLMPGIYSLQVKIDDGRGGTTTEIQQWDIREAQ